MTTPPLRPDARTEVGARLVERMEAEIRPLLDLEWHPRRGEPAGYDCCGCSSYDAILEHALRIVREETGIPPTSEEQRR